MLMAFRAPYGGNKERIVDAETNWKPCFANGAVGERPFGNVDF